MLTAPSLLPGLCHMSAWWSWQVMLAVACWGQKNQMNVWRKTSFSENQSNELPLSEPEVCSGGKCLKAPISSGSRSQKVLPLTEWSESLLTRPSIPQGSYCLSDFVTKIVTPTPLRHAVFTAWWRELPFISFAFLILLDSTGWNPQTGSMKQSELCPCLQDGPVTPWPGLEWIDLSSISHPSCPSLLPEECFCRLLVSYIRKTHWL